MREKELERERERERDEKRGERVTSLRIPVTNVAF